ncbi:hypothetical protein MRX96_037407 [Rhipicephalus microplus]
MRLESGVRGASACEEGGGDLKVLIFSDKPPGSLEAGDRGRSDREEPAADVETVAGFDKPPRGLKPGVGEAREERAVDVDATTGSGKPPGVLESGVGGASTDRTPASKAKQAEAIESKVSASTDFHVITLSEEQYISLLQWPSLPVHSKAIITTQQKKKDQPQPPHKSSGAQEPLTSHPTVEQQTLALQTLGQQMPAVKTAIVPISVQHTAVPIVPAQQAPRQQTTIVLAVVEVGTIRTTTFLRITEQDQRMPSGCADIKAVITTLAPPAATPKLTYGSVPAKPPPPVAAKKSLIEAEAVESEPSASTESHVISLSEEQFTSLLHPLNLPIQSKPIISIKKKVMSPCKCSSEPHQQSIQPSVPQQTIALPTPTQQMPAVQMSVQQAPVLVVRAQLTLG